jgi:hypothetical protein
MCLGRRNNRRLIVYLALSVHPVLKNHLICPGHAGDICTPTIPLGTFPESIQKTVQDKMHIIFFLLSLVSHGISNDVQDGSFVSTAISDGLNEVQAIISTLTYSPPDILDLVTTPSLIVSPHVTLLSGFIGEHIRNRLG